MGSKPFDPHHASLDLVGTNATLEAWVRPAMYPMDGALDHIIAKQSANPMNGYALGLHLAPAGAYQFGGYSGGSGVLSGAVANQGWTHIAVVWLPDESISLYQDGNPVRVGARQENGAGLALVANQEALILGNRFPLAGFTEAQFAFYGDIDTVRIYRRSRTARRFAATQTAAWSAAFACVFAFCTARRQRRCPERAAPPGYRAAAPIPASFTLPLVGRRSSWGRRVAGLVASRRTTRRGTEMGHDAMEAFAGVPNGWPYAQGSATIPRPGSRRSAS